MPDHYPDQTSYTFRPGVTCVTAPGGAAVLLDPPRSEKLTGLAAAEVEALKTLNLGPATLSGLSTSETGGDADALIARLTASGWLAVTVRDDDQGKLYSILPFGSPRTEPPARPGMLSKFTVLHRDAEGFVLEHPLSWCDIRIHDARLLPLLDGRTAADPRVPAAAAERFVDDLHRCGFMVPVGEEDRDVDSLTWNAPDLWFHRRSTLGDRIVTWEHFGPTKWARGRFPQPPARRPDYPGDPVPLFVPDLAVLRAQDPTLTAVVEDRVSARMFDDARPISANQLAELLYRTARTRATVPAGPGEELLSRPYPSAGGVYELEVYPVVHRAAGLDPGMYHYDSFEHALRAVAAADSPAVRRLLKPAAATLTAGAEPQVLVVIAARCGRIMWSYEQIGYATVLKDVGVLMQTMYLVATAMGLGVCAQGFGDTAAFAAATGLDERQECSVGSLVIGSSG